MEAVQIDGNNILEVFDTVKGVRDYCIREQKPYLIECMTFRMRGHEEASGTKYIPAELFESWAKKDPVTCYENYLRDQGVLYDDKIKEIRNEFLGIIDNSVSFKEHTIEAITENEIRDMYAEPDAHTVPASPINPDPESAPQKRFIDGIRDGLWQSMEAEENLVLMGRDIAAYGGLQNYRGFSENSIGACAQHATLRKCDCRGSSGPVPGRI
jgi:2-oxoisovalerate dehydrogenase E1 component